MEKPYSRARLRALCSIVAIPLLLSACGTDADGVPKIEDPRAPVVDGKAMPALQFVATYCRNLHQNETCKQVRAVVTEDSTLGVAPRF